MSTTEIVTVESTPAVIAVNFDEVKARLNQELEKYNIVVTEETLPGAKKLATELNKNAGEFDKRRKAAIESVSAPIKLFDSQMKELVKLCKNGRQSILDQVQVFEDKIRLQAEEAIKEKLESLWEESNVSPEFRQTQTADLVKLTAITAKGNLSLATISSLKERVSQDLSRQTKVEIRLAQLESASFKAGLTSPLTKSHIQAIIFFDDDAYSAALERILSSEIQRQHETEIALKKKFEAEAQAAVATAQATIKEAPIEDFQLEPEADPLPEATETESRYAIGPLHSPQAAVIATMTEAKAFELASSKALKEIIGLWVPGSLIAIAYKGEVFKKWS